MGTVLRALALMFALAFLANAPVRAQIGTTVTGSVDAVIAEPLSLVSSDDLNFGAMTVGTATGGTVTVSTAGVATTTGSIVLDNTNVQAATFHGQGTRRLNRVCIAFDASSILIRRHVGVTPMPETMLVDGFVLTPQNGTLQGIGGGCGAGTAPRYAIRPPNGSGLFSYTVGARLNVNANQRSGHYTGTFSMTAVYQ